MYGPWTSGSLLLCLGLIRGPKEAHSVSRRTPLGMRRETKLQIKKLFNEPILSRLGGRNQPFLNWFYSPNAPTPCTNEHQRTQNSSSSPHPYTHQCHHTRSNPLTQKFPFFKFLRQSRGNWALMTVCIEASLRFASKAIRGLQANNGTRTWPYYKQFVVKSMGDGRFPFRPFLSFLELVYTRTCARALSAQMLDIDLGLYF